MVTCLRAHEVAGAVVTEVSSSEILVAFEYRVDPGAASEAFFVWARTNPRLRAAQQIETAKVGSHAAVLRLAMGKSMGPQRTTQVEVCLGTGPKPLTSLTCSTTAYTKDWSEASGAVPVIVQFSAMPAAVGRGQSVRIEASSQGAARTTFGVAGTESPLAVTQARPVPGTATLTLQPAATTRYRLVAAGREVDGVTHYAVKDLTVNVQSAGKCSVSGLVEGKLKHMAGSDHPGGQDSVFTADQVLLVGPDDHVVDTARITEAHRGYRFSGVEAGIRYQLRLHRRLKHTPASFECAPGQEHRAAPLRAVRASPEG